MTTRNGSVMVWCSFRDCGRCGWRRCLFGARRFSPIEPQPDLRADVPGAWPHFGASARATHAADHRLAHAKPVTGNIVQGEPGATVSDENVDRVLATLDVDRHFTAGVACGVQHRLARGRGEVAAGALRRGSRCDNIDVDGVVQFERGGVVAEVGGEVAVCQLIAVIQPAA